MPQINFDAHHPPLDTVDTPAYPQLTAEKFRAASWSWVALTVLIPALLAGYIFYQQLQDVAARNRTSSYDRRELVRTTTFQFSTAKEALIEVYGERFRPITENINHGKWQITVDADGWRQPIAEMVRNPIAVFGDSNTEARSVAVPYPEVLLNMLGVGVYNYGYRGYGPVEITRAVQDFANREPRTALIWGYHPGSDISDTVRENRQSISDTEAILEYLFPPPPTATPPPAPTPPPGTAYEMPITYTIQGITREIAFLPAYRMRLQLDAADFEASVNKPIIEETLDAIDLAAQVDNACRILAYLPVKSALYTRYLDEPYLSQILAENLRYGLLEAGGALVNIADPIDDARREAFLSGIDSQRDVIRALIESRPGWTFIDLTPAFEQATARGELLYYPFDTHWNQAGHDLAAQVIAQALRAMPECLE